MSQPFLGTHVEDLRRSSHAVLPIYRHRPHVMGSDGEFPSASSVTVVARLSLCCTPSRSPSSPHFPSKYFFTFYNFLYINFCPPISAPVRARVFGLARRVRLSLPASARPSFTPELILALTHGRLSFLSFRDGAAAVYLPLPLVRTVWRVGLAEVAPSTPSSALLVDQIVRAASH